MLEIRDGIECYKLKENQLLISPDLNSMRIPIDLEFPPKNLDDLKQEIVKKLKKKGFLVNLKNKMKKPAYKKTCLLNKITFKNLDIKKIQFIFNEFLKNSTIAPEISIDCSLEVTSKLMDLIIQKYNENSIYPLIKVFIRENVDAFLKIIEQFVKARESIELKNLILIINYSVLNKEIINRIKENINPIETYAYYEDIPESITKINDFNWNLNLPILLEISEKIKTLDFNNIPKSSIIVNDDSVTRLLNALKNKEYLKFELFKKQIFLPYCDACNIKLFIEGEGKIYACNTGYRNNDQIDVLENKTLKEILNSEELEGLRKRIEDNSLKCQKNSCLAYFYSGCIYNDTFGKKEIMKKILLSFFNR